MKINSNKARGKAMIRLMVVGLFAIVALVFPVQTLAGEFELDEHTVALWHFDEGSGNTIYDFSPNNNNGTIYGASWADGQFGKALSFDGVDDYVNVPVTPPLRLTRNITIEVWFYLTHLPQIFLEYPNVVAKMPPGWVDVSGEVTYGDYSIWIHPRGDMTAAEFYCEPVSWEVYDDLIDIDSETGLEANKWYYIAGTYDGSEAKLYLNGQLEGTQLIDIELRDTGTIIRLSDSTENPSESYPFPGIIDEIRISNIARTAEEIKAHWEASFKQKPVAVAEPGLDAEDNLVLDGSKSSDIDGNIISFDWILANRDPAGGNFTLSGELTATDTVDIGVYDVTLTVTDNDGLTGTDTMVLAVPLTIQNISTLIQDPGDRGKILREIIYEIINPPGQQKKR